MIYRLTRYVTYAGCLLTVVFACFGRVYPWELIVWGVAVAIITWVSYKAHKMAMEIINLQEATINGQHELIKQTISELSRRNAENN
jgi:Ca2+/Na+ antiporter